MLTKTVRRDTTSRTFVRVSNRQRFQQGLPQHFISVGSFRDYPPYCRPKMNAASKVKDRCHFRPQAVPAEDRCTRDFARHVMCMEQRATWTVMIVSPAIHPASIGQTKRDLIHSVPRGCGVNIKSVVWLRTTIIQARTATTRLAYHIVWVVPLG